LNLELASNAGSARLAATGRPFEHPARAQLDELRFDGVDLAAWTGVELLRSALDGSLRGEGVSATRAGAPPRASGTLRLERSRFGQATLDGGELQASLAGAQANVEGTLRTSGSELAVRGDAVSRAHHTSGHASCSVPFALLAAIAGHDSLPSRGALVVDARFAAEAAGALTAEGSVNGSGGIGRTRLDTLAAAFRLERGLLRIDTLLARSNVAAVRGGGRVAVDRSSGARRSDLSLHFETRDVSPLRELLRADTVALASGSVDVTLGGSDSVRTIAVGGSLRSLAWNAVRISGAELTSAGVLGRTWHPTEGSAKMALRQLQGLPLPIRDGSAEARLEGSRVDFVVAATADARSSGRVRGHAAFDSLATVITLDSVAVVADTASWRLAKPSRITVSPTRWSVDDLDVRSRSGRFSARGTIDRRGEQDLDVVMHDVTIPGLAAWVGRRDLSGDVDGRFSLRGRAAAPRAEGQATLTLFTAGEPAGSAVARLAWADRHARLDGAFSTPGEDSLSWSAQLPFAASLEVPEPSAGAAAKPPSGGPVHVRVVAHQFPLAAFAPFLDPHAVGSPSGRLDVDARIDGDERSLAGGGKLEITGGALPLTMLGVTYGDLELHAEFQGDRLLIRQARAVSGKGTLEASGEVRFASIARVEPKLHVKTHRFVFANSPDLKALASCELDVTGTLAAPVVKGSMTVGNSSLYFTQPDLAATEAGSEVKLTPADVRMMEERFGYVAPRAPALPLQLYDASDLELAIKMERDNWVRQRVPPKMAVALTGDFRLRKRPHAEPELFGKIEPIPNRGYVQQFARSFDITGGDVLLNGKMKDHAVSIHAQFKPESGVESQSSNDVVVRLDVEGTPDHLRLTLSSEPPMSEAEIVNFIATGRSTAANPTSTNSSSESSLLRDIGLSQLTGSAETAAQEAVGLDVLEVRYDPLRGATLVAGRYVDPQLYVGFRSPLDYSQSTSPNSSNSTSNTTAFEVEYAISRWLVLNLQGDTAKFRSFIRARRAY
jgi:autotransporter translocation and assembly factor TamB